MATEVKHSSSVVCRRPWLAPSSLLLPLVLLLLSSPSTSLLQPAAGRIHLSVASDTRRVIDLGTYGFGANGGNITLTIAAFSLARAYIDDNMRVSPVEEPIGFVIDKVPSATAARVQKNYASKDGLKKRVCFIHDPALMPEEGAAARRVFAINGMKVEELRDRLPREINITVPGLYAIFFYNCRGYTTTSSGGSGVTSSNDGNSNLDSIVLSPAVPVLPSAVTFDVSFSPRNIGPQGQVSYLSVGLKPLPVVYGLFTALFVGLTILWAVTMAAHKEYVRTVHQAMMFLVAVKTLSLLFETLKYLHFDSTGRMSALDVFYYILLTIKGISLFTALILLGTGWSVVKSYLSDQDRKLLMVLLPCQVVINILLAVIEETSEGNRSWQLSQDVLQILDLVCCLCVLLPLVSSMRNLRKVSESDDKAAQAMSQMSTFRSYYLVIVCYIYTTRIVVVIVESLLPYDQVWAAQAIRELIAVAFYTYSGYMFRPHPQGAYSQVNVEDVELSSRREVGHM